jgi:hypothetical protein
LTSAYFNDLELESTKNIVITGFKNEISAVAEQESSSSDSYLINGCPLQSSKAMFRSLVEFCRFSNGTKRFGTINKK